MTWYMKVINYLIAGFGHEPTHFPDSSAICRDEYIQFFVNGRIMFSFNGVKYEIIDPKLLEKLTNDIQAIVDKDKLNQS